MRASCVITTRDRKEMVCRAIGSVHEQHHPIHEVIVVDDGSVDGTHEHIRSHYPRVFLERVEGLGPGRARNVGAGIVTGDVLLFLDSDDQWLPGHADALVSSMEQGWDAVYGCTETHDEVDRRSFYIPSDGLGVEGCIFQDLLRWCFMVPSTFAVRKDVFLATGGFPDLAFGEDWIFFLRLASEHSIGYAGPEPITIRHLHHGSLCRLIEPTRLVSSLGKMATHFMERYPVASAAERFMELAKWSELQGRTWTTVQNWYLDLKEDGML